MSGPILPGGTLGVLGSGQLGRMFALAARRMGYFVHTFSPEHDSPTGQVADVEIVADYSDLAALRRFAEGVDAVTFEFENVLSESAAALADLVPVRPSGHVLHTTQHRLREKTFLRDAGLPVTPFAAVNSLDELHAALETLGTPAVLKTAGFGYDGKGQNKLKSPDDAAAAWKAIGQREAVLEAFVDFQAEASVVAARGVDGSNVPFEVCLNDHVNHILDITLMPAPLDEAVQREAVRIATAVMEKLDVVGVLCTELFITRQGKVLINELAPRPHNSGHLTIEACHVSQFEQQVRAVCALPLGDSSMRVGGAAMANLLGDLWVDGEPDWAAALQVPGVSLHLYGKHAPRPGRKMGHLTAVASDPLSARELAREARQRLTR